MLGVLAFVNGFLAMAPTLIKLGADLTPLVSSVKGAIADLFNGQHITDEQRAVMSIQVSVAEAAWAVEVARAQAEVDKEG